MLKAELEKKLEATEKELSDFKKKVDKVLKRILEENCEEAIEHVEYFCDQVGMQMPTKIMKIQVPAWVENIRSIEDDNYIEVTKFKILDYDVNE